jgi:hypothetical protein
VQVTQYWLISAFCGDAATGEGALGLGLPGAVADHRKAEHSPGPSRIRFSSKGSLDLPGLKINAMTLCLLNLRPATMGRIRPASPAP